MKAGAMIILIIRNSECLPRAIIERWFPILLYKENFATGVVDVVQCGMLSMDTNYVNVFDASKNGRVTGIWSCARNEREKPKVSE